MTIESPYIFGLPYIACSSCHCLHECDQCTGWYVCDTHMEQLLLDMETILLDQDCLYDYKSRLDAKTTVALGSLVGKMALRLAAQLPVFLSEQVRAVMTNLQDMIDAGTAATKDVKKTMPKMHS